LRLLTDQTDSMTRARAAAKAFEEALEEFSLPEDAPVIQDPEALGRRAALLAVSETVWGQALGPLFDIEQARTVLQAKDRQAVSDLERRGRLLVLPGSGGRKLYPALQFDPQGRPYPEIEKILDIFSKVVETPYTIASWLATSQDLLDGETPSSWLRSQRDPELVFEAAKRSADKLAH
jgi:hypothetical protein